MGSAIGTRTSEAPAAGDAAPAAPTAAPAAAPTADRLARGGREIARRARAVATSPITRKIVGLNIAGLLVLAAGAWLLAGLREELVDARAQSLLTNAELLANAIAGQATVGEPEAALDPDRARRVMKDLFTSRQVRARLFDNDGVLVADSFRLLDEIVETELPPARPAGEAAPSRAAAGDIDLGAELDRWLVADRVSGGAMTLEDEVALAVLDGQLVNQRLGDTGARVVSVALPVKRVQIVVGVLVLEAGGIDAILDAQRRAQWPFLLIAFAIITATAVYLTFSIAEPLRGLAAAVNSVRRDGPRAVSLPDLSRRRDEIGDLSLALKDMTAGLSERIDAIERFAADVAHEIKNPLTSIRSAVETLPLAKTEAQRDRLLGIVRHDVGRIDRLITDIAGASRVDAELGRARPERLDLAALLGRLAESYGRTDAADAPRVRVTALEEPGGPGGPSAWSVDGFEGPLGRVFCNIIDNALTFSPPGGEIVVRLSREAGGDGAMRILAAVEDQGPGIPPENLERVFERFYTSRPEGAAFGANSGLGLAIAKRIVEAHGGHIHAENRQAPGENGARFVVTLPQAA